VNRDVVLLLSAAMLALIAVNPLTAQNGAERKPLPEGPGLAAKYPGDVGIDKDPNIVFVENFEHPSFDACAKRWESVTQPELMSLSDEKPSASGGKKSLQVRHVGGESSGGHLYRRLPPGHDKLFVRFNVKFAEDCNPIHHFFHVGGYNPTTAWPQGGAGVRPKPTERFTVGLEPFGDTWSWDAYAYWSEMGGSPPRGQTWGNNFLGSKKPKAKRGEWQCIEAMIQMNDVDDTNGELALWIDGQRVGHFGKGFPKGKWIFDKFMPGEGGDAVLWSDAKKGPTYFKVPKDGKPFEGFRWRTNEKLKINFLWVLVYITKAPNGHVSTMWFDDIVVAKEYVGPIAK
jgi:hypothetical protein